MVRTRRIVTGDEEKPSTSTLPSKNGPVQRKRKADTTGTEPTNEAQKNSPVQKKSKPGTVSTQSAKKSVKNSPVRKKGKWDTSSTQSAKKIVENSSIQRKRKAERPSDQSATETVETLRGRWKANEDAEKNCESTSPTMKKMKTEIEDIEILKIRFDKMAKETANLQKKLSDTRNVGKSCNNSIAKMRKKMKEVNDRQPKLEASIKAKHNLIKECEKEQAETKKKEEAQNHMIKDLEREEQRKSAYIKAKAANNSALHNEAIRLKEDNKRLKGNITNILMNMSLGIMTGRL